MKSSPFWRAASRLACFLFLFSSLLPPREGRAEAMLQYFNTDWNEIAAKMPELAEAGYTSLWLPPPTKGSGGLSVGYDLWDRFDLGSKDQRNTVRTRYGTEADLLRLVETAHRFGIRVYFDNIMNHNAFDVPGFNASTPIDVYPGFVPEDFHLRVTSDGFYRKWDNVRSYGDAWQVQNLGLADLIDIAHETPNTNFGASEGDDHPKISFVRTPLNPEYYLDLDLPLSVTNPATGIAFTVFPFANKEPFTDSGYGPGAVGTGNGRFDWDDANGNGQHDAGETSEPFEDTGIEPTNPARRTATYGFGDNRYNMGNPVPEDVGAYLIRSARWLFDRTHADGLRLDAVKHVPDYFFGQQSGANKDASSAGYLGQAQEQFNITRGFSDWDNHRDTLFDTEKPRDDAMMFGEHLGSPPGYGGYWDAGMRLVDNDLRQQFNDRLGSPSNGLNGFDQPGAGGFQPGLGVMHAQSHDNDYASRRELQHAFYFTRAGIGLLYTDGNHQAETLGQSGGAFPRHANTAFLGQFGDGRIPNLLYIHNQFARGSQKPVFSDGDFVAYERIDKRESTGMSDADGVTMLFMLNDNYANGQARGFATSFPAQGGSSADAYLFNYSTYGGGFYTYASALNSVVVPPGGYFAFSWRSPEQPDVNAGAPPITILQDGNQPAPTLTYMRKDGPDGDPDYNPKGVPNDVAGDYQYAWTIPRVTSGTNLRFLARADGSAENMLLELDGGIDLNSQMGSAFPGHPLGDPRDHPPALSTDAFLGYEQMRFVRRTSGSNNGAPSVFPGNAAAVAQKKQMETVFEIADFNATTIKHRPHIDYGPVATGLAEGFHILRSRAFLSRAGRASIYNTFAQTFYYDIKRPEGEIKFPAENDTVGGQQYGAVVRADPSVTEVWYKIDDGDANNDDSATLVANGNGGWVKANELTASLAIRSAFPREWRFNYSNIPSTGAATISVRLKEVSSSSSMTLDDMAGHYTTLTRFIQTRGPDARLGVAFPASDGETVGPGYVMKARFSKSLADGLSMAQLIDAFLIRIASSESGSASNGIAQSRNGYSINYNVTNEFHELAFTLPNLYNGRDDFLHTLTVTLTRAGQPTLEATRMVRAFPTPPAPLVNIVNPPEFTSEGRSFEIVLPAAANPTPAQRRYAVRVETDLNATSVSVAFTRGAGSIGPNPNTTPAVTDGNTKFWDFTWSDIAAGSYELTATVTVSGGATASSVRNATVVFRQLVAENPNDLDDDDDGLYDALELTIIPLPAGNSEAWVNGDVHVNRISGHTNPLSPDSDGDGLPDGLENGWVNPGSATNTGTDTDGDGVPNFLGDADPPIFNTTDNSGRPVGYENFSPWPYDLNRGRADLIAGTLTDPTKPDTDDDSLLDGIEDNNRNGRVEIGLRAGGGGSETLSGLLAHPQPVYNSSRTDRTKLPANAIFLETDPNDPDTDGDGLADGSEDVNHNGRVDLAVIDPATFAVLGPYTPTASDLYTSGAYVSRRIKKAQLQAQRPDVIWLETDPTDPDLDGDGLPDGWEVSRGLNPFDDGIAGHRDLRTGRPSNPRNGAAGDPDNDGFSNAQEFLNNTDPFTADTGVPPPPGTITIGPAPTAQQVTRGSVVNRREFTDWTASDLIALDEYDGDGPNNQGSDVYHAGDGFDSSRDLVAFYAHDGGDTAQGGDGNFYFRADFHDLRPYAEEGNLDLYVAINFGSPGAGEKNLPDDVDTLTNMGWQAVIACYSTNNGRVYVDTNPASNSSAIGQELTQFGVQARDQNAANGFKRAYFDSTLDAVEFSISRQALRDAGWNGLDAADLIYQVFTTKDGTGNSPVGPGDLGGRSDIRDSITDDGIASDYYLDQANIAGSNSILRNWVGIHAANDRGRRVKVVSLIHGNQAIQPGSVIQGLVNTGAGAGYYRPLDVHDAYATPLAMHITPTLASALQWAAVNPAANQPFRDGPALNARVGALKTAGVVDLLGSTFSDHPLPYASKAFNRDNVGLANDFLATIYGSAPSSRVFWTPERVSDADVLDKVHDLGFTHTFVDQMRHVFKWFGRQSALGTDGYRLNRVNDVDLFVINDGVASAAFANDDGGSSLRLRNLLENKARTGPGDQVIVLMNNWEEWTSKAKADAYDANIRWLASHPWVQLVTPDAVAAGQVDLSQPPDGAGDVFGVVARGTGLTPRRVAHDFLDHATEESYDNWYAGSGLEESLRNKRFSIRSGVLAPTIFGQIGAAGANAGVADAAWNAVAGIPTTAANSRLLTLARATVHASMFETAFHDQANNDLSKFSTGAYINPDGTFHNLAAFSKAAQSQTRAAAVYARVTAWSAAARAGNYANAAVAETTDTDLDGENEFLLFNDRLFAVFERIGGRMTAAWLRDIDTGAVLQVSGNLAGYAGGETEEEGASNTLTGGALNAFRTSGFKDWFAKTNAATGAGTSQYVNDLYAAAPAGTGTGWTFTSSDGKIAKTITLAPRQGRLAAAYALAANSGIVQLFTRFGLSPDLADLLVAGQAHLRGPLVNNGEANLFNESPAASVRAFLRPMGAGVAYNPAASDADSGVVFSTVPMRNQAQTQQLELGSVGGAGTTWSFTLGFETGATLSYDTDGDGLPDAYESANGLDPNDPNGPNGPNGDPDGDGKSNRDEFILGTSANVADVLGRLSVRRMTNGSYALRFPSLRDRVYRVLYTDNLQTTAFQPATGDLPGTGAEITFTDDGSTTSPPPANVPRRFYRLEARLP